MQFIPLNNLIALLRFNATNNNTNKITQMNGYTYPPASMTGNYARQTLPFYAVAYSNETYNSSSTNGHTRFIASSDTNIISNAYVPTNIVGTTVSSLTINQKGWTATITVTGSGTANETINSIYVVPVLQNSNGMTSNTMIGALKLDNPVELNADNNYTANFTFAIEF